MFKNLMFIVNRYLLSLLLISVTNDVFSQTSIPLTLNTTVGVRNITTVPNGDGSITLTTTGTDPYISVNEVTTAYDYQSTFYLSFDYISTGGLDDFTVFYGVPSAERRVSAGAVPPSSVYKTFVVNLKRSPNWTTSFTRFRLDFGTTGGQTIQVKNITLRTPTPAEFASDPFIADQQNTNFLRTYLNTNYTNKINKVKVSNSNIIVESTNPNGVDNLFLCELRMFSPVFKPEDIVFSQALSNEKVVQTTLDRYVGQIPDQYDRIYSRWVIAEKNGNTYTYKSHARFADDISQTAVDYIPEEKPENKKGVGGFTGPQAIADLEPLGLKSITSNIVYSTILSLTPTSLPFVFNGKTYYMNPTRVAQLDDTYKGCLATNTIVSAIILIPIGGSQAVQDIFRHPDSEDSGIYSMANVASLNGLNYYAAITAFLAERYSRKDKLYGRITNWIVHNEVDAGSVWTNAGQKSMESYTELYDRSMRTVYYTIRKYNPSGKVFISLTHHWALPFDYAPKNMLEFLVDMSKKQGDYEWGVAYHPYPENLFNYATWNDTRVSSSLATSQFITPKNIELIDTWMRQRSSLYQGLKVRSLMFSEQGIHAGANYDQATFTNQAAGVAYMWKKFNRLPSLEAIQYHRRVDNTNEGGLYMGLWTTDKTSTNPEIQNTKKLSWSVWQAAGTANEASTFNFALPIIGVNNWEQTFNPLVGEVNLCKVDFAIKSQNVSKNGMTISFNGEQRQTETAGSATFFNVASLSTQRSYQIKQGEQLLWPAVATTISTDQVINVNLDPVSNLSATPQSSTSIKVNWEDITNFEKGYVLESKTSDQGDFTKLADINPNTTSFDHTGLIVGKTYQYRLYAFNDTVTTLHSKVAEATVDVNTAVGDVVMNEVSIYPNPSAGDVYVQISDQSVRIFNFKLFDVSGKTLLNVDVRNSADKNKIVFNPKPINGVYFAQISYNGAYYKKKIVIQ